MTSIIGIGTLFIIGVMCLLITYVTTAMLLGFGYQKKREFLIPIFFLISGLYIEYKVFFHYLNISINIT